MKKLTKANTNYARNIKINEAVAKFLKSLNAFEPRRWAVTLYTDNYGDLGLIDSEDGSNYGVKVYESNGDTFIVPGFADETWNGTSLKGQDYSIDALTEKPVLA
jgi:hypothetical protein